MIINLRDFDGPSLQGFVPNILKSHAFKVSLNRNKVGEFEVRISVRIHIDLQDYVTIWPVNCLPIFYWNLLPPYSG